MAPSSASFHILFLTTYPPAERSSWNLELYEELVSRGVKAEIVPWRDPPLTVKRVCQYTHVIFLACGYYIEFIESFQTFIKDVLIPAQEQNPSLRIINDPQVIAWNSNKIYLNDIQNAGILEIPKTVFFSASQPLDYIKFALASRSTSDPVVVKPSVSSSGLSTRLIKDPYSLTDEDESF